MIRSTRGSKKAGQNTGSTAAAVALLKENDDPRVQLENVNKGAEVSRGRERKALRGVQAQPNQSNPGHTRSLSKGGRVLSTTATRSKSRDSKTNKRFSGNPKEKEEAHVDIKKEPELPEQMVKKTAKQTPKAGREQQSTSRSSTNASKTSMKNEDHGKRRRCMLCGRNCGSHEDLLLHMDEHSHLICT